MSDARNIRRRWRRWIKRIREYSETLAVEDSYFRLAMKVASEKSVPAKSEAYQWVMRIYWQSALLGIRRLIDKDKRTYSIYVLLKEIESSPELLARASFRALYRDSVFPRGAADDHFDSLVGVGAVHVPASFASNDLEIIEKIRDRFRVIQDQFIAHNDRQLKFRPMHKWQEVHDAIQELEHIAERWEMFLFAMAAPPILDEVAEFHEMDFSRLWCVREENR